MEFTTGLNVLVGENNIGKTNILDSIRIAIGTVLATKEDLPIGGEKGKPIKITLIYHSLSEEERAQFIDILNFDARNPELSTAQINFEWSYNESLKKWSRRRWGGTNSETERSVPEEVLQSLQITALDALRDARSELKPGPKNRLASLIDLLSTDADKARIIAEFDRANQKLQEEGLIQKTSKLVQTTLTGATGTILKQDASIANSESDFEKIIRNLRLLVGTGIPLELSTNGLGYNNLLFIACIISELGSMEEGDCPLLLVEEPEAHLHPQLQTILASFLSEEINKIEEFKRKPQIIVTTHSPTIAAHIAPSQIRLIYTNAEKELSFFSLFDFLEKTEENKVRRMLDVTRASMLFAKGIIFVEGESENILLPVLAKRKQLNLEHHAIAIVPVSGVDFNTLASLFGQDKIGIKVSLITDSDPKIIDASGSDEYKWSEAIPHKEANGIISKSDRVKSLITTYSGNSLVKVFTSDVTLEYDLAFAGEDNPTTMTKAWEDCYTDGSPRNLNLAKLNSYTTHNEKVLAVWRGICLSNAIIHKPVFAQELAENLSKKAANGNFEINNFAIPEYIKKAFEHVLN